MPTVFLTRRERFNAAHKLWVAEWDDQKNEDVFGKCANKNWHGHNYQVYVTVKGEPDSQTGMVMDLKKLKDIINRLVIDDLDHRNLDMDVAWLKGKMSSAENIAIAIWERLEQAVKEDGVLLHQVRLWETENNIVDYYG